MMMAMGDGDGDGDDAHVHAVSNHEDPPRNSDQSRYGQGEGGQG